MYTIVLSINKNDSKGIESVRKSVEVLSELEVNNMLLFLTKADAHPFDIDIVKTDKVCMLCLSKTVSSPTMVLLRYANRFRTAFSWDIFASAFDYSSSTTELSRGIIRNYLDKHNFVDSTLLRYVNTTEVIGDFIFDIVDINSKEELTTILDFIFKEVE